MNKFCYWSLLTIWLFPVLGFTQPPKFNVIAFYTAENDLSHISFVQEANEWFPKLAEEYNFSYESTNDWENLNADFLSQYDVVLFLDTRPDDPLQRKAFQTYLENGGSWMGFHFSAFALTPSTYPMNWNWYHNTFLGSGSYVSNTWRPTSAVLRIEDQDHPVTQNLTESFESAPNEWYRWSNDLRDNPDIHILLSIDPASFPLGTGPKSSEIWHSGYYPVVWTNLNFNMVYINMGHNDMDYEHNVDSTETRTLSYTFKNKMQNQLFINSLMWLGEVSGISTRKLNH